MHVHIQVDCCSTVGPMILHASPPSFRKTGEKIIGSKLAKCQGLEASMLKHRCGKILLHLPIYALMFMSQISDPRESTHTILVITTIALPLHNG